MLLPVSKMRKITVCTCMCVPQAFSEDNEAHCKYVVVSSYKESRNNKPIYGYMLPNLSPSPNLYKVESVYNNNVAS